MGLVISLSNVGHLEYRTMDEVPEEKRTEWIADRTPLFDEQEIAKLCDDPLNETLTPAHVDTVLQHAVLFQKRPVLIVSSANSATFDITLRALGYHADISKSERRHLAAAAVPELADGFLFGDTSSYELVILPIYVPGHYVRLTSRLSMKNCFVGPRYLRCRRRVYSLLRQLVHSRRTHA